jgi:hypothetical protein
MGAWQLIVIIILAAASPPVLPVEASGMKFADLLWRIVEAIDSVEPIAILAAAFAI